jgi:ketopantoate hydroxymethyltransferase
VTNLSPKKVRTSSLAELKAAGKKFSCLTSYDSLTAEIFDEAGIDVLLVGDSAADNALGYSTTLPITVEEIIPFARAVAGAAKRSLVVVDLPFGSYESNLEPQPSSLKAARSVRLRSRRLFLRVFRSWVTLGLLHKACIHLAVSRYKDAVTKPRN